MSSAVRRPTRPTLPDMNPPHFVISGCQKAVLVTNMHELSLMSLAPGSSRALLARDVHRKALAALRARR